MKDEQETAFEVARSLRINAAILRHFGGNGYVAGHNGISRELTLFADRICAVADDMEAFSARGVELAGPPTGMV